MIEPTIPLSSGSSAPPRRRRGLRWLIALLVLFALLAVTDRVAAAVAENLLADRIQQDQKLASKPSVSIGGVPFLTQVAARHFDRASVDIHDLVTANGVPVSEVRADLTSVHVASDFKTATADEVDATVTLDYTALSNALTARAGIGRLQLAPGADGDLQATYQLLGLDVSAEIRATVLPGDIVELKSVKFTGQAAALPFGAIPGFDVKLPLAGLPFGMQVTGLQGEPTGVKITADGSHVVLSGHTAVQ